MKQELGETVDAMMQDDFKEIEDILRSKRGNYWILVHHKPTHVTLSTGQKVIKKLIKAYDTKPPQLVGTMVLEVRDGSVNRIDVHPHDAPLNWGLIHDKVGFEETPIIKQSEIANTYFYN